MQSLAPSKPILSDEQPLDLLIIGGGPIGLATALGAIHHGAKRVLVVEQARSLEKLGQHIELHPYALNAIRLINPQILEKLTPFLKYPSVDKPKYNIVNVDAQTISTPSRDTKTAVLLWWQLQQLLISLLPTPNMLLLNHRLVDITHNGYEQLSNATFIVNRPTQTKYMNWEGDRLKGFSDSSSSSILQNASLKSHSFDHLQSDGAVQKVHIRAKIIVGADGIDSVVRRCIYRDIDKQWEPFSNAVYTGLVRISVSGTPDIFDRRERSIVDKYLGNHFFSCIVCRKQDVVHGAVRMLVFRAVGKEVPFKLKFIFYLPFEEHTIRESSADRIMELAVKQLRAFSYPEDVIGLIESFWEVQSSKRHSIRPLHILPVTYPVPFETMGTVSKVDYPEGFNRPWYHKRMVLVGDALHASPPIIPAGAAMGMEDVYELVSRMSQSNVWNENSGADISEELLESVFTEYREARLERLCFVQKRVINMPSDYAIEENKRQIEKLMDYKSLPVE